MRSSVVFALFAALVVCSSPAGAVGPKYIRTLAAGTKEKEFATHDRVKGIAVHPVTNEIYFIGKHQILKLANGGAQVQAVAGTGERGQTLDGAALTAPICPQELMFSPNGTLFFTDAGDFGENRFIRMLTPDSRVVTLGGNGSNGFDGDGAGVKRSMVPSNLIFNDQDRSIYFLDDGRRIRQLLVFINEHGQPLEHWKHRVDTEVRTLVGKLKHTFGSGHQIFPDALSADIKANQLALDPVSRQFYFTDGQGTQIKRFNRAERRVELIIGREEKQEQGPRPLFDNEFVVSPKIWSQQRDRYDFPFRALAFDPRGRLHLVDRGQRIIQLDLRKRRVNVIAGVQFEGTKPQKGEKLPEIAPVDLLFTPSGDLYFTDQHNLIRFVQLGRDRQSNFVHTVAGTTADFHLTEQSEGNALEMLIRPKGLALGKDGKLIFFESRRIRVLEDKL